MLLAGPVASASGEASVRLVHAVPGAAPAQLVVSADGAEARAGTAGFGEFGEYAPVPSDAVDLRLASGSETVARASETLDDGGRYTVAALSEDGDVELRLYRDGPGKAGVAKLRLIHATPELGEPELKVGETVATKPVEYKDATPYLAVEPGTYEVAAIKPGGDDEAIASRDGVALSAGSSSTAVIVGSRGEQTRIVVATDATTRPRGAPRTGLGGLAGGGGDEWLLVLAAALIAGALGGAAFGAADAVRRARA
jgi:hypothetical protein